ncbi:MAG: NGG1p interacting factor NIF3 [Pseudomonadota bacterium]
MYMISFYVPESHCETVMQAMFSNGAGRLGNYDSCAWVTLGKGQFRPLQGSQPFLGRPGTLSRVDEYKVELVCGDEVIQDVLLALKKSHPYEEPAYHALKLITLDDLIDRHEN